MEFRILGPLEVEEHGRVLKVAGVNQRGLLALLIRNRRDSLLG